MDRSIGERISQARLAEGLSQEELGHKIGLSQAMISHWETGRMGPSPDQLNALERVFGSLVSSRSADDVSSSPTGSSNVFGAWLRKQRSDAQMSVAELAGAAGLSQMAIYNIESGRIANPQAETRLRLEKALNKKTPDDVTKEAKEEQNITGVGTLVDFDPHNDSLLPSVAGVYVFYDISDRPIYIGKSENIASRVRSHSDKFWFKKPIVESASYVEIRESSMRHSVEQVLIKFLKSNAVINKQSVDR